jgi:hypothetical protein
MLDVSAVFGEQDGSNLGTRNSLINPHDVESLALRFTNVRISSSQVMMLPYIIALVALRRIMYNAGIGAAGKLEHISLLLQVITSGHEKFKDKVLLYGQVAHVIPAPFISMIMAGAIPKGKTKSRNLKLSKDVLSIMKRSRYFGEDQPLKIPSKVLFHGAFIVKALPHATQKKSESATEFHAPLNRMPKITTEDLLEML